MRTMRERENIRRSAAKAVVRARNVPESAPADVRALVADVEGLANAVEILCDYIANLEFHRT